MKIQVVIEATSIQEYTEAIQALAAGYTVAPAPSITEALKAKAVTTGGNITGLSDAEESKPAEAEVKCISAKVAARLDKKLGQNLDQPDLDRLFKPFGISDIRDLPAKDAKAFEATMDELLAAAKEADKPSEEAPTSKAEKQDAGKAASTDGQEGPVHGFPAVKAIAMKLNKIQDGKAEVKFLLDKFGAGKLSEIKEENYDEFHELASKAIADHDNAPSNDSVSESNGKPKETVETKEDKAEDKEVTLPMIRGIAKQLADQGFKDEIRQVLKDHGAASLTKIDKKDYPSVYDALVAYNG